MPQKKSTLAKRAEKHTGNSRHVKLQMNEIILGSLEPPESKQISRPRMDTVDSQELLMKKTGDVRIVENER